MTTLIASTMDTPFGTLRLIGSDAGLRAILWPDERDGRVTFDDEVKNGEHAILRETIAQLQAYIDGDRDEFDLPLDPAGTEFQRDVWDALREIPYGQTSTYGELADRLDRPGAARAVGAATGRNPISIVVPCHRLVGSNGALTGFAGGIETKRRLLEHESNSLF